MCEVKIVLNMFDLMFVLSFLIKLPVYIKGKHFKFNMYLDNLDVPTVYLGISLSK